MCFNFRFIVGAKPFKCKNTGSDSNDFVTVFFLQKALPSNQIIFIKWNHLWNWNKTKQNLFLLIKSVKNLCDSRHLLDSKETKTNYKLLKIITINSPLIQEKISMYINIWEKKFIKNLVFMSVHLNFIANIQLAYHSSITIIIIIIIYLFRNANDRSGTRLFIANCHNVCNDSGYK